MSSISSSQPIHIEILGQSFSIKTDDGPEYIQSLVEELKQRYARISTRMNVADPLRVAILAGLFLLDEVKKARGVPSAAKDGRPIPSSGQPSESATETTDPDEEQILAQLDKRLGELGL